MHYLASSAVGLEYIKELSTVYLRVVIAYYRVVMLILMGLRLIGLARRAQTLVSTPTVKGKPTVLSGGGGGGDLPITECYYITYTL